VRRTARKLIGLTALVILASPAATAVATPATGQTSTATATVAPSTNLVTAQIVEVSWSGMPPSLPAYVFLCEAGATNPATQCTVPSIDLPHYTSTSTGTGDIRYFLGQQLPFTCDNTHACTIDVLASPTDLTSGPVVPLAFARPPEPCPAATSLPVAGEGTASAAYTYYAWENAACNLPSHINAGYTSDNSFDGMSDFVNSSPNANFAITGVPLPPAQAAELTSKHRGYTYAPFSLTGVAIAYNIVDQNGNQIKNLVLTPQIVAEIATGNLSTFDCPPKVSDQNCIDVLGGDPEIRELNPGVKFPDGPIQFFDRSEHSASNLAFTTWLSQTAPSIWTYGPSATWPSPAPNNCATCPPGVTGELQTGQAIGIPINYTATQVYIGVVDTTTAAIDDIPVASIVNPGQPNTGVAPTTASLQAAVADATPNADGTITPNYTTSDPNAYPLPMLSYAIVPTTERWPNFSAADGVNLSGFLNYAVTGGQSSSVLPAGSFPLPAAQVAQTQAAAAKIPTKEPTPPGGGHHHHHTGGGNTGGQSGFGGGGGGTGNSGGGGSGPAGGSHPQHHTKPAPPKKTRPLDYTLASNTITSPASQMTTALAILAAIGILAALIARARSGLPGAEWLRGAAGRLRRGAPSPS
jgi:ABC-type phosphate transport system substrate-binding protein